MAYSEDYRKAAIEFKQSGHTFTQLKEVFKITAKTYYEWVELLETTGSLKYRNASERKGKIDMEKLELAMRSRTLIFENSPLSFAFPQPLFTKSLKNTR